MKAFGIAFLILALIACIGVLMGHTHQAVLVVISLLMAGVSFTTDKKHGKANQNQD